MMTRVLCEKCFVKGLVGLTNVLMGKASCSNCGTEIVCNRDPYQVVLASDYKAALKELEDKLKGTKR